MEQNLAFSSGNLKLRPFMWLELSPINLGAYFLLGRLGNKERVERSLKVVYKLA